METHDSMAIKGTTPAVLEERLKKEENILFSYWNNREGWK